MKVYTASKLSQSPRWIKLKTEWPEIEFTARWVTNHVGMAEFEPHISRQFWTEDEDDVRAADVVLLYAEHHEKQRGSLVEAGMAIALRKPVILVGESADFGSWQYHPAVTRFATLEEAREHLALLSSIWSRL